MFKDFIFGCRVQRLKNRSPEANPGHDPWIQAFKNGGFIHKNWKFYMVLDGKIMGILV
jgi:hypothetical protein